MAPRASPLALIFLTVFLDLVGFGIVIPVLPLYAERFGASPLIAGALLATYSAMQSLCAPLLGRLSDRIGRRPVLLASILGTAVGFLLMGCAKTLGLLFLARAIDGATGGNISTAMAYIADISPPAERSRRMGLIGVAFGLGFIFGPAIGGVLSHISLSAPFLFAAALAAANMLAVYVALPESLPQGPRRPPGDGSANSLGVLLRDSPALRAILATYGLTTVAFSMLTATYPLITERRFGFGASQNGYIFALLGTLSALVQGGLLGWLIRRSSERRLVLAGTCLLAAGFFALPAAGTITTLLLATAVIAIGHGCVASTLNGLASQGAGPALQGRVLGAMQSAASLARIIGPVAGGWLLNVDLARLAPRFGERPYYAGGLIMLAALALAASLRRNRETSDFRPETGDLRHQTSDLRPET